jgi:hypothetical protein
MDFYCFCRFIFILNVVSFYKSKVKHHAVWRRELDKYAYFFVFKTVQVEVKLSLCLTKHHAMNTYWGVDV